MSPLESELGIAMMSRYEQWKAHCSYRATRFKRMMTSGDITYKGPVGTAKHLIGKPLSEKGGFLRLKSCGRPDLTIEALVQEDKWKPLFHAWELDRARERTNSD